MHLAGISASIGWSPALAVLQGQHESARGGFVPFSVTRVTDVTWEASGIVVITDGVIECDGWRG